MFKRQQQPGLAFSLPIQQFDGNEPPPNNPPPPPNNPPPQPQLQAPPPPPPGETDVQRVARLERALADTRAEAAAYRIDARTSNERQTALQTELEQARAASGQQVEEVRRNADSQVQAERQLRLDAELKAAAVAAGLSDPDLLPLINKSGVKVDASGNIVGIAEAIAAFKTAKPAYFRDMQAPPPPPPPVRTSTGLQQPPPVPGAAPPTTDVRAMPKADYQATKRAALAGLRGAG